MGTTTHPVTTHVRKSFPVQAYQLDNLFEPEDIRNLMHRELSALIAIKELGKLEDGNLVAQDYESKVHIYQRLDECTYAQ